MSKIPAKHQELMLDFGISDESRHNIGSFCRMGIDPDSGQELVPHTIRLEATTYYEWVDEVMRDWEFRAVWSDLCGDGEAMRLIFKRRGESADSP